MKTLRESQTGIAHLDLLLAILVIALVGLVAYRVNSSNSSSDSSQSASVQVPNKITSKQDLRQADQALQAASIGSDLNPKQLDSSINSLL